MVRGLACVALSALFACGGERRSVGEQEYGALVSADQGQTPTTAPIAYHEQRRPSIARGTSSHLITWCDQREGVEVPRIYAVVNETDLSPLTQRAGFRLGEGSAAFDAVQPAVAFTGGVYLVAWSSDDDIRFARVDEAGTVLDAPAVDLYTGGAPGQVSVAGFGGTFVVGWVDDSSGSGDLMMMRVDAATGAPIDLAPVMLLTDAHDQGGLTLRASTDGFWAVFQDARGGSDDIHLIRLDATGAAIDPAPVNIVTRTGAQYDPDVAFTGSGTALVVWRDDSTLAIHGANVTQAIDLTLTIGAQAQITPGVDERGPRVAYTGFDYLLVWYRAGTSVPYAGEVPSTGPTSVTGSSIGTGQGSRVDVASGGGTEAVWEVISSTTLAYDVLVAQYLPGPDVWVPANPASRAAPAQFQTRIGVMGSRFFTAWVTPSPGSAPGRWQAFGSRVTIAGAFEDALPITLSDLAPDVNMVDVASNSTHSLVVWSQRDDDDAPGTVQWRLMGRTVDASGATSPIVQLRSATTTEYAADVWVTTGATPQFKVTVADGSTIRDIVVNNDGTLGTISALYTSSTVTGSVWLRSTDVYVYYQSAGFTTRRVRRSTAVGEIYSGVNYNPDIARRTNQTAIVWEDSIPRMLSMRVHDDTGALVWELYHFRTSTYSTFPPNILEPKITTYPDGYFLLWREVGDLYGARVTSDGVLLDPVPALISDEDGWHLMGDTETHSTDKVLASYSRYIDDPGVNDWRARMRLIDFGVPTGAALGTVCVTGWDCLSGYCIDGVCCDTGCGFGATDCQACSVAAGAAVDGTCAFLAVGTTCRASAGECDTAEACTGAGAVCPADVRVPAGTTCGPPLGGPCDLGNTCDGASVACVIGGPAPSGTLCRPAAGWCDLADTCSGTSAACPDVKVSNTNVCRTVAGVCDVVERCDGVNNDCPADAKVPAGTGCRSSMGVCDMAESCNGINNACPVDGFRPAGTACRNSNGECDVGEACTGASRDCPANQFLVDGTPCGADDDLVCNGIPTCRSGLCSSPGTPLECPGSTCSEEVPGCVPIEPPPDPEPEEGGCSCRAAAGDGAPASALLLLIPAVLLIRGSRRTCRRSSRRSR